MYSIKKKNFAKNAHISTNIWRNLISEPVEQIYLVSQGLFHLTKVLKLWCKGNKQVIFFTKNISIPTNIQAVWQIKTKKHYFTREFFTKKNVFKKMK